jgi:hypothetical protein
MAVLIRLGGRRGAGKVALVDEQDAPLVEGRRFHLDAEGYPATGKHLRLHRLVMGRPPAPGLVVDHRNGIKTDNRRANLEWVPQAVNARRYTSRRQTCRHGHRITPASTYLDPRGKRDCLVCRRERDRRRRQRAA